ncbi:MAG: hypothetical protein A3I09_03620 [Deltaproteobacteria bacterium RIFCSPLOWO2_02_FULL_47_10]|nr:MAG: hypothetical protein A3I09_03620 [Deltaproteobacteria bacterium RIFCSPLOWO2_02_FULL_47_10]
MQIRLFARGFLIVFLVIFGLKTALATDLDEYQKYGDKNSKWDEHVGAGFSSFDSGNLGAAEMFLQRALARGCKDGLVYAKIGLYYEDQGNYKKALSFMRLAAKRLSEQYPSHQITKSMHKLLGRVLFLNNQSDEAEPYLQKAVNAEEDFTSLYLLGQIRRMNGAYPDAVKLFERALVAKRPTDVSPVIDMAIMTELGKVYYEMKQFDVSLKWWDKILSMDPANQVAPSYKQKIEQMRFKEKERKILEEIVK